MSERQGDEVASAKQRSVRSVGGPAIGVFAATAGSYAIGLITSLITAHALGPSGQGTLWTLRADATFAVSVLAIGAPAAVYYYASVSRDFRQALLGFSAVHAALLFAVTFIAVLAFGDELAQAQGRAGREDLYLIAVSLVPLVYLEVSIISLLRGEGRSRLANVVTVIGRAAGLIAVVALVLILGLGIEGALVAAALVSVAQLFVVSPTILKTGLAFSRSLARKTISYGFRAQFGWLSRVAADRFDILLLSFLASPRIVGYYALAQIVAEVVLMVPRALGWVLGPVVTSEGQPELTQRVLRLNGTVALVGTAGLAVVGPFLIAIAFGDAFRPAIAPFLILLPGIWMLACGDLVLWVLRARGRPGTASWLAAYLALATVALDVILIPKWGANGAALASAIAYTSFGLAGLWLIARYDGLRFLTLILLSPSELRLYAAESHQWARRLTGS